MVGGAKTYYSFELLLEIRGEKEDFKKYGKGGRENDLSEVLILFVLCSLRNEHQDTSG